MNENDDEFDAIYNGLLATMDSLLLISFNSPFTIAKLSKICIRWHNRPWCSRLRFSCFFDFVLIEFNTLRTHAFNVCSCARRMTQSIIHRPKKQRQNKKKKGEILNLKTNYEKKAIGNRAQVQLINVNKRMKMRCTRPTKCNIKTSRMQHPSRLSRCKC